MVRALRGCGGGEFSGRGSVATRRPRRRESRHLGRLANRPPLLHRGAGGQAVRAGLRRQQCPQPTEITSRRGLSPNLVRAVVDADVLARHGDHSPRLPLAPVRLVAGVVTVRTPGGWRQPWVLVHISCTCGRETVRNVENRQDMNPQVRQGLRRSTAGHRTAVAVPLTGRLTIAPHRPGPSDSTGRSRLAAPGRGTARPH